MELRMIALLGTGKVGIYDRYPVTFLAVGEEKRLWLCHLLGGSRDGRPMMYVGVEFTHRVAEVYREGLTLADVYLGAREYWEVQVDQRKPIRAWVSERQAELRFRIGEAVARQNHREREMNTSINNNTNQAKS